MVRNNVLLIVFFYFLMDKKHSLLFKKSSSSLYKSTSTHEMNAFEVHSLKIYDWTKEVCDEY